MMPLNCVIKTILIFIINFIITTLSFAQITIAPTNLFIDSQTRFGSYMVINSSTTEQEISVDFLFGYSISDSLGNRSYIYDDSVKAEHYSVNNWVRAFPQNFTLAPNQRQVVRLRINAPSDLPAGTYFSRIRTSTTNISPPVEVQDDNTVSANIGITINQLSGLFFKNGSVNTGIEVENISTKIINNKLIVLTEIKRTGNSPFLGTITTSLIRDNGNIAGESFSSTTIHFDMIHRDEIDLNDIPSGQYNLRVHFDTRRSDISQDVIIQMEPVTATTTVTIP